MGKRMNEAERGAPAHRKVPVRTVTRSEKPWLPDWRNAAYPRTGDLSPRQWAWQFLRRNPEYQKDHRVWRALIDSIGGWKRCAEMCDPKSRHFRPSGFLPEPDEDMRFWRCDPPALPGEDYAAYRQRTRKNGCSLIPLHQAIAARYGLRPHVREPLLLSAPDRDRPHVTFDKTGVRYFHNTGREPGIIFCPRCRYEQPGLKVIDDPGDLEVLVWFDLSWPLKVQLERAETTLRRLRRSLEKENVPPAGESRMRSKKYPIYLRVLDGAAAGTRVDEMAAVLFPDIPPKVSSRRPDALRYPAAQKVREHLKAAEKLRDGGYRLLAIVGAK